MFGLESGNNPTAASYSDRASPSDRTEQVQLREAQVAQPAEVDPRRHKPIAKTLQAIDQLKTCQRAGGVLTPQAIAEEMRQYVVGNERVIRVLSIAAHNHFKRCGLQISVAAVKTALSEVFELVEPDSERADDFIRLCTRVIRQYELNLKQDNQLRSAIDLLLKAGREDGLLRYHRQRLPDPPGMKPGKAKAGAKAIRMTENGERFLFALVKKHRWEVSLRPPLAKENILLLGSTGSGKTWMVETLSKILGVQFLKLDATVFTEAGYHGEDASSIPKKLLEAAGKNKSRAEQAIVFIDEIDKKAAALNDDTRDVSGKNAQASFLKLIEGFVDPETGIDLANVLFIFGGAFQGLEHIVQQRLSTDRVGFLRAAAPASGADWLSQVAAVDLINYGMMPELIGRIPRVVATEQVTVELLKRILVQPVNSIIRQKQTILGLDGVRIDFSDDALELIAKTAQAFEVGARPLAAVVSIVTEDLEFAAPNLSLRAGRQHLITAADVTRSFEQHQSRMSNSSHRGA